MASTKGKCLASARCIGFSEALKSDLGWISAAGSMTAIVWFLDG